MTKLIPIQSVSDIITNSSSECFMCAGIQDYIDILNKIGLHYIHFKTPEDVYNVLKENPWILDEYVDINVYTQHWLLEELKKYYTTEVIWDFFTPLYQNLIGKVVVYSDCLYDKVYEANMFNEFNTIKKL